MNRDISDTRRRRPDCRLESVSSYISIRNTFDAALITITLNRSCRGGKTVDIILTVIIKKDAFLAHTLEFVPDGAKKKKKKKNAADPQTV